MRRNLEAVTVSPGRTASREVRRQQLIEATIGVLAAKGYAALTLADVARAAGLSVGIIDFHFEGKEKLLAETLRHLAAEYQRNWSEAMAAAGPSPAARLAAVLRADFDPEIYAAADRRVDRFLGRESGPAGL